MPAGMFKQHQKCRHRRNMKKCTCTHTPRNKRGANGRRREKKRHPEKQASRGERADSAKFDQTLCYGDPCTSILKRSAAGAQNAVFRPSCSCEQTHFSSLVLPRKSEPATLREEGWWNHLTLILKQQSRVSRERKPPNLSSLNNGNLPISRHSTTKISQSLVTQERKSPD